jgi:hypothetical protein
MVEQPFVHQLQPLPEHCARLQQDGLIGLGSMELKSFHVAVLLMQPVAYLQQGAIHRRIVQGCTDLQGLLDVVLQPLPDLVGDFLLGICQAGHFLDALLRQVHRTFNFLFRVILQPQADVLTP